MSNAMSATSPLALDLEDQAQMTRFLQRLVQTPSPFGSEAAVARLIQDELQRVGVEDVRVDQMGNVVARIGSGDGPTLLYDGHMDTVLPTAGAWPFDPFAAEVRDGVLYGLGSCDMKGSLSAMIYAAGRLLATETPLQGSLVLAFVVQEEPYEGCALREMLEEAGIEPGWVLLGEPTDMCIMRGHRGRVMFKVSVMGKSSHGSRPDLGSNAITNAARVIFGVEMMAPDMVSDPFLGAATAAVTHIESQAASRNAIPSRCDLYVDRRLTLGETVSRATLELESLIAREGLEATIEVCESEVTSYTGHTCYAREAHNPWALDQKHPLLVTLYDVVEGIMGRKPPVSSWGFSTDGVYSMGQRHIPTIGFGPGNPDHAHSTQDQVRLTDVAVAAHVYAALAAALLTP
jgi:putative selenium metabolism hydrolase